MFTGSELFSNTSVTVTERWRTGDVVLRAAAHLLATPHLHLINVQVEESEAVATQTFVASLTSQSLSLVFDRVSFFHISSTFSRFCYLVRCSRDLRLFFNGQEGFVYI